MPNWGGGGLEREGGRGGGEAAGLDRSLASSPCQEQHINDDGAIDRDT